MKKYLGLDNTTILNGTYKLLRNSDTETEFIGIANYKDGLLDGDQKVNLKRQKKISSLNVM